jgi:hypothetical protein
MQSLNHKLKKVNGQLLAAPIFISGRLNRTEHSDAEQKRHYFHPWNLTSVVQSVFRLFSELSLLLCTLCSSELTICAVTFHCFYLCVHILVFIVDDKTSALQTLRAGFRTFCCGVSLFRKS